MTGFVQVEDRGAVRTVRIVRPEKRNALTLAMYRDLAAAVRGTDADPALRVTLIAGVEGAFSAGNDLEDFLTVARGGPDAAAPILAFLEALVRSAKPLVAAVDGVAVGVGSTLLLHCDLVYATPAARFQFPFVDLGLVPEAGSTLLLPRLAGAARAAELLLLGTPFDAVLAERIGLVNAVVPPESLTDRARAAAAALAGKPPQALAATRALVRGDADAVWERVRREAAVFAERLRSPELAAAVAAFRADRGGA